MIRRALQFYLLRQFIRAREQVENARESMRRPIEILTVFLSGAQIRIVAIALVLIIGCGSLGYSIIFGWNLLDALFMTMITISSVGYGEVVELTATGQAYTIALIALTFTFGAYGLSSALEYIASGQFARSLKARGQEKMIHELRNHFIIAGYGRVGQEVAMALTQEEVPFLVVEPDEEGIEKARSEGFLVIEGNATEDQTLEDANIAQAQGIICATASDATNVYVVLTARGLNDNLFIISRASDENSEAKLRRAGADRVISPYVLSGQRMANLATRPYVVEFLDVTGAGGELEKSLEQIAIEDGSIISNRTLGEVDLQQRTGALLLGLYLSSGSLVANPNVDTLLEPGSRMIVLGTRDALDVAEALAANFMKGDE